jgi:DNA-binding response OmpR family regulator
MVTINTQRRILLADSDREMLISLRERLVDNGFEVVTASDGREAIKIALSQEFEIIIAAMVLPAVKGLDFINVYNRLKPDSRTPVIITGNLNDADYLGIASMLHASEYIQKPFEMSVLLGKIDLLLEEKYACLNEF